jgi:hypothetical protein
MSALTSIPTVNERGGKSALKGGGIFSNARVDLIPPEIEERNRQLGVRRGLRFLILLALVVVIVGIGGTWYLATSAELDYVKAQQRTGELQGQQAQFADVRTAQQALALGEAALRVGGSTEIDWQDYLQQLQASLPAGVSLQAVRVDSIGVVTAYPQSDVPLEGARIATLTFTAKSTTLPMIPDWLDRLRGLPGFVDAIPGSVTLDGTDYTASITMHIDSSAYSNRLTEDDSEDADTTGTDSTGTDTTGTATEDEK